MRKKFKNKDLAARLGVSGTLVSLVLNNKADQQGIRKDTQEKVLTLARQMGYFESLHEKDEVAPVDENPGVIGMVVPSLDDPFVYQIAPFLHKVFSDIGVGFSLVTKDPDDQRYDRLIGAFKKFYCGLILLGDTADENTVRSLRSTNYPFILLEKSVKLRLNTVNTDTVYGAMLIVNHIEKLGYKNIIIITDRKSFRSDPTATQNVLNAIEQKTDINRPVVVEIDNSHSFNDMDLGQFEKYLRPPYRADVIIIMNADLVYPIITVLRKRKLRIPQDIALVSMEEGPGFDLMYSPITCLRKPLSIMSMKIANMIWSEVKNSGKGKFKRQVNITPELIIRSSCGTV
ncbi:MAG: LacI family transcriptional regulator [Bacteroidales bacterium]|nr:LacI family transcriptional regulator [Bacteroidales bacterium]